MPNKQLLHITGYGHSTNRPGHHSTVVARTVGSNASCHSHSLENATHLAGNGVQVLIYMGQMQPAIVAVYDGVLTLDVTAIQISTCSRKLSIKVVFMEMTTRKWYI